MSVGTGLLVEQCQCVVLTGDRHEMAVKEQILEMKGEEVHM